MEARRNWFMVLAFLLVVSQQDLFVKAGEYNFNCPDFSQALGDGCSVSSICSTITCKLNFGKEDITLEGKINKCDSPVTITITIKVPDLYIDWSHEYSSGDIVEVPGFTFTPLGGLFSVGVYVQVVMTDNGDQLTLAVDLFGGAQIGDRESYPVKAKVFNGKLPISTDECDSEFVRFWKKMSVAFKVILVITAVIVLMALTVCSYYCCCKETPARVGVANPTVTPVVRIVATDTENVPMQDYDRTSAT